MPQVLIYICFACEMNYICKMKDTSKFIVKTFWESGN